MAANDGLIDYMYYANLMKLKGSNVLIGLSNALINVDAGGGRELEDYFNNGRELDAKTPKPQNPSSI